MMINIQFPFFFSLCDFSSAGKHRNNSSGGGGEGGESSTGNLSARSEDSTS